MKKYNFAARAVVFALALTAAFAFTPDTFAQAKPGSLWYNGDFNDQDGLANMSNGGFQDSHVYDNFLVTDGLGWNVNEVWSSNLLSANVITDASYEIRSGVSAGNGGTLLFSGLASNAGNALIVQATGRSGFGFTEYKVNISLGLALMLGPGQYWLNVTPIGNGGGDISYNSAVGNFPNNGDPAINCVGTPCGNDGNAFFTSGDFGFFFEPSENVAATTRDFSMGVVGTVVPEPATVALLTCGLGTLLFAVRRRRAS